MIASAEATPLPRDMKNSEIVPSLTETIFNKIGGPIKIHMPINKHHQNDTIARVSGIGFIYSRIGNI